MDNVFTVYKLIILYMLDRAEGEVTQGMLSTFLLEGGYANFVSLAESYDQLEKQGLVNIILRGNKKFLKLTEAGQQALGFFGMQLSPQIRRQADNWLIENGQKSVKEKDVTLLEVKLSVPDAASAEAIAARWEEKNAGIYQYLIENLF